MPIILPQLDYIIFQLVSFTADKPDVIREEMVVTLVVNPTMIQYEMTSRDAVYQTSQSIFTDKFPIAPVRGTLNGTFGQLPRLQSLSLLDGFGRLKEMELLFRRSHSTNDVQQIDDFLSQSGFSRRPVGRAPNGDPAQRIYGLNYYDFMFHQFFAVNLQTFRVFGNARQHSILKYYDLAFVSTGRQFGVVSRDPLLFELTTVKGILTAANGIINDALTDLGNNPFVQGFAAIGHGVNVAAEINAEVQDIIARFTSAVKNSQNTDLIPIR